MEELKQEVVANLSQSKRAIAWDSVIISAVLGILAVASVSQTVLSVTLYNKLKSGNLKSAPAVASPGAAQNLPDMVGGC